MSALTKDVNSVKILKSQPIRLLWDNLSVCLTHRSTWAYCFHQETKCTLTITFLVLFLGGNALSGLL